MKRLRPVLAKLSLSLLVPVLFLGMLEGILRVAGVGYPTTFLIPETTEGREVWQENPFFTYQIFPPPLARAPSAILVDRVKDPDVLRVVVLGESAAQGDPLPVFGPPRALEKLLSIEHPDRKIEVINAAVTAINSHIIRIIAEDLQRLAPDVVILYIGNNEVIGPYGPGTVFAQFVNRDATITLSRWIRKTRLAHLFTLGFALAEEKQTRKDFGGVAMFKDHPVPADDPRLEAMYRRYRTNVQTIIGQAHAAGAKVLLSTVAVNRSDCPPSISVHGTEENAPSRMAWEDAYTRGNAAMEEGAWSEALDAFRAAEALDAAHAELHFRMGECLDELGDHDAAGQAYDRAMNLDAFRYRTDSRQNQLLRDLAADSPVTLVDADLAFFRQLPGTDADRFVDHVHFSPQGTYDLVRLWADAMADMSILDSPAVDANRTDVFDHMLFNPLSDLALTQRMLGRYRLPPFNQQLHNEARIETYATRVRQLTEQLRARDPYADDPRYEEARARYPHDLFIPIQWANQMMTYNRYRDVVDLLSREVQAHPSRRANRAMLARGLAVLGRDVEAAEALLGWSDRHGYFAFAELASIVQALIPNGQLGEASSVSRAVLDRVHPLDYRWRIEQDVELLEEVRRQTDAAKSLVRAGRLDPAEQRLVQLVTIFPDAPEPHYWRGVLRGRGGDMDAGIPHIETAMQSWGFARAYYHVALWEARIGHLEVARERLLEAARRAGDDRDLINSVAWMLAASPHPEVRNIDTAHRLIESALERGGESDPILLDTSAALAAIQGDMSTALARADRARELALSLSMNALVAEIDQRRDLYRRGERAGWGDVNAPMNVF